MGLGHQLEVAPDTAAGDRDRVEFLCLLDVVAYERLQRRVAVLLPSSSTM
jgi:hypothetical protein